MHQRSRAMGDATRKQSGGQNRVEASMEIADGRADFAGLDKFMLLRRGKRILREGVTGVEVAGAEEADVVVGVDARRPWRVGVPIECFSRSRLSVSNLFISLAFFPRSISSLSMLCTSSSISFLFRPRLGFGAAEVSSSC